MSRFGRNCAMIAATMAVLASSGSTLAQNQGVAADPQGPPAQSLVELRAEPVPPAVDAAFRAWDSNHDGSLDLQEFRNGWRNFRRGPRQTVGDAGLRQQFDRIDADNNGGIDRDEYPNLVLVKRAGALASPFSEVDRNHDQKLDFAEYSGLVHQLRAIRAGATPPTK